MTGTARQAIQFFTEYLSDPSNDRDRLFDYDKHREKRSKDANSYFWLLVHRLAVYQGISDAEVHDEILSHHINLLRDEKENCEWIASEREPNEYGFIKEYHAHGCDYYIQRDTITLVKENGEPFRDSAGNEIKVKGAIYWHIKGTHQMNSLEMSRVIDEIIMDCEACGIETKTRSEIDKMLEKWAEQHG